MTKENTQQQNPRNSKGQREEDKYFPRCPSCKEIPFNCECGTWDNLKK